MRALTWLSYSSFRLPAGFEPATTPLARDNRVPSGPVTYLFTCQGTSMLLTDGFIQAFEACDNRLVSGPSERKHTSHPRRMSRGQEDVRDVLEAEETEGQGMVGADAVHLPLPSA